MDDLIAAMSYVESVTLRLTSVKEMAEIVALAWRRGTISEKHILLLEQACQQVDRELAQSAGQDLC